MDKKTYRERILNILKAASIGLKSAEITSQFEPELAPTIRSMLHNLYRRALVRKTPGKRGEQVYSYMPDEDRENVKDASYLPCLLAQTWTYVGKIPDDNDKENIQLNDRATRRITEFVNY